MRCKHNAILFYHMLILVPAQQAAVRICRNGGVCLCVCVLRQQRSGSAEEAVRAQKFHAAPSSAKQADASTNNAAVVTS